MGSDGVDAGGRSPRKRGLGFWPGALIACMLAALWTAIATVGITFPTAETGLPDPTQTLAFHAGAVARAPLMVGVVIWALAWALFWRLPSFPSALLGLVVLIAACLAVSIPVRLSLAPSVTGDDLVAINFIQSTTTQFEEIVSSARDQARQIGIDSTAPPSGWSRDLIETRLQHLEQALPIARSAMDRLESSQRATLAAVADLDVSENTRNRIRSQLEWVIGSSPSVVEAFRSELLVIEKSEEQFSYLEANASGWDIQDGRIAFRSEHVFRRFNQLGEELSALAQAMTAATQATQARRQATLASSPFDTTPKLFGSFSPSSVDQIKRASAWSYLILMRAMMSVAGAALLSLLAAPIVKLSARNIAWARIVIVAFRSFLPALLGISFTYAVYVDVLGKMPFETPALLLTAWLVFAGWLISRAMKHEGVVRRFPGIGTRVIVGLFVLSWLFVGLAYLLGPLTSSR